MKKFYVILAAVAGITLTSCTSNDYLGDYDPTANQADGSIQFGLSLPATTRADIFGGEAAKLLGYNFYVTGTKGTEAETSPTPTLVFDNYLVHYDINSAGKTESNTANWEYVGVTPGTAPTANYVRLSTNPLQTIKYWDYSVAQYDFLGFSTGVYDAVLGASTASTNIGVTKMAYGTSLASPGIAYTFSLPSIDALKNTYITDITEVSPANYGKEVQLKFKNLGSKVRIALYETVPGYSVKDVNFYQLDGTTDFTDPNKSTTATLISADANGLPTNGTIQVYFPHVGSNNDGEEDYNKAAGTVTPGGSYETYKGFGTLTNYASEERFEASANYLGRSLPDATFAGSAAADYYETVFPVSSSAALTLRVDYTLVPIDGAAETITVKGAKAVVPSTYTKWLPNYAYTYIFKISDNTNGWTGTGAQPAGLFPITFDAVVTQATEATAEQTTITTVATPTITTYQQNHDITKDEYSIATGKNIYVQVMDNSTATATLKGDLNGTTSESTNRSLLFAVSKADATEAEVMDALQNRTTALNVANIKGRNTITLTNNTNINAGVTSIVNGADDNPITVTAGQAAQIAIGSLSAGTYAYVYDYSTAAKNTVDVFEPISVTPSTTVVDGKSYITTTTLNGLSTYTAANEAVDDDYIYFSKITTDGGAHYTYSYVSVIDKTTLPEGLLKVEKASLSVVPVPGSGDPSTYASANTIYFDKFINNDGKYAVKVIKVVA